MINKDKEIYILINIKINNYFVIKYDLNHSMQWVN